MTIENEIKKIIAIALEEDLGSGDATGNAVIPAEHSGRYVFNTREEIIFCGEEVIRLGFDNINIKQFAKNGEALESGAKIAEIEGNTREILAKERVVLNLIQHLSRIATETAKYVKAVEGTNAKILDTRKTTPGLRVLEKFAVKCGGGQNHRMGLYDMVMVKDNHIKAAGGITEAIKKAHATGLKVEVECDNLTQIMEAIAAKPDVIMADNMGLAELKEAVDMVHAAGIAVEASGNINLGTVRKVAETGVDFISTSKITVGSKPIDIGLDELI